MKRLIGSVALLLGAPLAAASAQEAPFSYFGVELGNASLQDIQQICAGCKDSGYAYSGKFGFAFTDHLNFEGRYLTVGDVPADHSANIAYDGYSEDAYEFAYAGRVHYHSFGGAVKGRYPLTPNIFVTGSLGIHIWDRDAEIGYRGHVGDGANSPDVRAEHFDPMVAQLQRDGDDITYGVGAELHFGGNMQGEISYTQLGGDHIDVNAIAVGLALKF